jgi:prepilin-type N-terminal cleavage/methylation domain-containing protein
MVHTGQVPLSRDIRSGGLSACCVRPARRGFTLVEVVVASAILLILLISLMASFASGVSGFKQAQLLTFAQNLAEFQAEDLKALAPSVLRQLCEGTWTGVPPTVDQSLTNYPSAVAADPDNALAKNVRPFEYDSGRRLTDFNIIGVDAVVKDKDTDYPLAYRAGGASAPTLPTNPPLLLGSNIDVESYEQTDSPNPSTYYYVVKLHKEAYPLFTKQIRVVCYDSLTPIAVDPWDPAIQAGYHFLSAPYVGQTSMDAYVSDQRAMFAYVITIRYKLGAASRVLYETSGVISAPFSS